MCTSPLEAWTKAAGNGTTPTAWCAMMSDVLFLVVPKKELDKVLALPGHESLGKVRDEIQVISCSSEVGAALFQAAWRTLVLDQVCATIEKSVKEMLDLDKLDSLALITHVNKWNGKLDEIPGLAVVTGKREVKFDYRGMPFVMAVRSVQEQHSWSLKTALRAAAAARGVLHELPGEKELCSGRGAVAKALDVSMMKKAQASRGYLERLLAAEPETSGESVMVLGLGWTFPCCPGDFHPFKGSFCE